MKPKLFVFVLGLIVGLLIALAVPPLIGDWLPEDVGDDNTTTGQVVAKRLQDDRLLLTIEAEQGAVLATFKERVPEIDLLVDEGDRVTLGITHYEPFVEDPKILSVNKGEGGRPGETDGLPAPPADESEDDGETGVDDAPPLPPMGPPLEDGEDDQGEGAPAGAR